MPFNAIYVADPHYLDLLCEELGVFSVIEGNLVFSEVIKSNVCFARDVWLHPTVVTFETISTAVRILRGVAKLWYCHPLENIRRSRLIESELRKLPSLKHTFPIMTSFPEINCFSLLDKNTLIYTTKRWKKPPMGDFQFIENKVNPPNRAYLKLWEALSLWGDYPKPNETALDLGASPGGWTYVMQTFGMQVTAVDKALLAPHIAKLPGVSYLKQSAFALKPEDYPEIDWLLCDVACYPERTYALITQWITSGRAKKMIFTIKLQGPTDVSLLKKFQDIPGARVIHLFYNKHEATFFYPAPEHLWI
jgi:23S rRNA (cytidine2498-2'-O)-methyltransferase